MNTTISFIGGGNMARCLIAGIRQGWPNLSIIVCDRNEDKLQTLAQQYHIQPQTMINKDSFADIVFLAIKPQGMPELLQTIQENDWGKQTLFITVAAGLKLAFYQQALNEPAIIRAMPNTPTQHGVGVIGLAAGKNVTATQKEQVSQLLASTGLCPWVEDETKLEAIMAVAGCGPAYFYHFMQAMQNKAQALGLDKEQSKQLCAQTALGAATMALQENLSFTELTAQVTSKGGATAEAIAHFEQKQIASIIQDGMECALKRAQELSQ